MDIFELIGALVLGLIFTATIGFIAVFGFNIFWKTIGRITKPLTPLFNYYTKLRIREYALYFIIESIIAYIIVMIPFILFAGLAIYVFENIFALF